MFFFHYSVNAIKELEMIGHRNNNDENDDAPPFNFQVKYIDLITLLFIYINIFSNFLLLLLSLLLLFLTIIRIILCNKIIQIVIESLQRAYHQFKYIYFYTINIVLFINVIYF